MKFENQMTTSTEAISFNYLSKLRVSPASSSHQGTRSSSKTFSFDLSKFQILKLISESKFQVYFAKSKETSKPYAIKVFPYQDDKPHKLFYNEAKHSFLSHINIVKTLAVNIHKEIHDVDQITNISYVIQEFAPYGDLYELITRTTILDEKFIRTLFHQLIDGLSFLHDNNIAHLDIKLENLLIGKDHMLKIADFDLAQPANGSINELSGSPVYRAPEIKNHFSNNLKAADVHSAGIVLFSLKNCGRFPHLGESNLEDPVDLFDKLYGNPDKFWSVHERLNGYGQGFFCDDFKELFMAMVAHDPSKRLKLEEVKKSSWYQKETYTASEFKTEIMKYYSLTQTH